MTIWLDAQLPPAFAPWIRDTFATLRSAASHPLAYLRQRHESPSAPRARGCPDERVDHAGGWRGSRRAGGPVTGGPPTGGDHGGYGRHQVSRLIEPTRIAQAGSPHSPTAGVGPTDRIIGGSCAGIRGAATTSLVAGARAQGLALSEAHSARLFALGTERNAQSLAICFKRQRLRATTAV